MINNELHNKNSNERQAVESLQELLKKHRPRTARFGRGSTDEPAAAESAPSRFLNFLMVIPWLLGAGFLASFFWDFNGIEVALGTYILRFEGLLRYMTISGLIGFGTNWIAIQMLFYPRDKRPLLGQGLIPSQKNRIADKLAETVERDLINRAHIRERLTRDGQLHKYGKAVIRYVDSITSNEEFRKDFRALITHYIRVSLQDEKVRASLRERTVRLIEDGIVRSKLEKTAIRLYLLLKGKKLDVLLDEIISNLPDKIGPVLEPVDNILNALPVKLSRDQDKIETVFLNVIEQILENIDVKTIVRENINAYDELRLEQLIRGTSNAQLRYIKYLGGIIGAIGGLVIWNPASLLILLLIGTGVWVVDQIMYKKTASKVMN